MTKPKEEEKDGQPDPDEVLRRMLHTPPEKKKRKPDNKNGGTRRHGHK